MGIVDPLNDGITIFGECGRQTEIRSQIESVPCAPLKIMLPSSLHRLLVFFAAKFLISNNCTTEISVTANGRLNRIR